LDLGAIPIIDHHAHNLLRPEQAASHPFGASFSEAYDPEVIEQQVKETLFFKRSLRDLAALLDCPAELEAILGARHRLGFEPYAERCFTAGKFAALLLDDGLRPDRILPLEWHRRFGPVYRILRLEHLAEQLIASSPTWDDFTSAFRAALDDLPPEVVSLKSILAYRTGLALEPLDPDGAAAAFRQLRTRIDAGERIRLAAKPLNEWLVWTALEAAARRGLPIQFHTGFGDPDLDLRLSNPLHLRPLFEAPALRSVPFVLLHASYPFTREAGYLAAVYPNVHLDLGLAIPFLSIAGMRATISALLELTPLTKLLLSTDAHDLPDLYFLGAKWARQTLAAELERAVHDGDLTMSEAESAAAAILHDNALALYGLSDRVRTPERIARHFGVVNPLEQGLDARAERTAFEEGVADELTSTEP
jgi:predicted TIM-barrel fold metal-dependent hydrolase